MNGWEKEKPKRCDKPIEENTTVSYQFWTQATNRVVVGSYIVQSMR